MGRLGAWLGVWRGVSGGQVPGLMAKAATGQARPGRISGIMRITFDTPGGLALFVIDLDASAPFAGPWRPGAGVERVRYAMS